MTFLFRNQISIFTENCNSKNYNLILQTMILISAFLLGLLGSMHCVGLCGPIVMAIPVKTQSKIATLTNGLVYNFGRTLSYSFLGAIFGLIGESLSIFFLQANLSIAIGTLILLYLILPKNIKSKVKSHSKSRLFLEKLKSQISRQISRTTLSGSLFLGVLNGLLPCGLVYAALAGAVATGSLINSIFYMALFGLGTLPAMTFVYYFKNYISLNLRHKINKLILVNVDDRVN